MLQDPKSMFRKAALDKLASPEQLDVLMQITSPRNWAMLYALGALIVLIIAWSIFGTIPTKVSGQGILLRGDAVLAVSSLATGQITAMKVSVGEQVVVGQVIAEVGQPAIDLRLANQRARLAELTRNDAESIVAEADNLTQSLAALDAERVSVDKSIVDFQADVSALRERMTVQDDLVKRGLLTRNTVLGTRSQIASSEQAIGRASVRLAEIATQRTTLARNADERRDARRVSLDDAQRQISELESQREGSTLIRSPYAGRVLEIASNTGDVVSPGRQVLTIEDEGRPLEAVIYVPALEGKRIKAGMDVRISPSTVKAEEFGFMLAKVRKVSDFPVSPDGLRRTLRNDALVEVLSGKGAPVEVQIELQPDPELPSGFRWSSSVGPPAPVFSGTLATATVVVERRRPISMVIPVLKRTVGAN